MHARQINARNVIFAAAIALWPGSPSFAADAFKATVGQRGNWDTSVCYLGEKGRHLQEARHRARNPLHFRVRRNASAGDLRLVDLGFAVGTLGAMAAYAKGAPVRIIGAEATGAADYWYAKASSPIKTLADTNGHTIAFSTNGSSTQSDCPGLHRRIQAHCQANGDRQSLVDAHRRDDRSGGCGLGLATIRTEGTKRPDRFTSLPRPRTPRSCAARPSA